MRESAGVPTMQNANPSPVVMHPNLVKSLKSIIAPCTGEPSTMLDLPPPQQQQQLHYEEQTLHYEGQGLLQELHQQLQRLRIQSEAGPSSSSSSSSSAGYAPVYFPGVLSDLNDEMRMLWMSVGGGLTPPPPLASPLQFSLPGLMSPSTTGDDDDDDDGIDAVPVELILNRRPYVCGYEGCQAQFRNEQTRSMHCKTHPGLRAAAEAAAREARARAAMMGSIDNGGGRKPHNKKRQSKCPKCRRLFVGMYELRRHYGRKHTKGEKKFRCEKCHKRFYIEVDLRDHEKGCGLMVSCACGQAFAFKCNLVAHRKSPNATPTCHLPPPPPLTPPSPVSEASQEEQQQQQQRRRKGKQPQRESIGDDDMCVERLPAPKVESWSLTGLFEGEASGENYPFPSFPSLDDCSEWYLPGWAT